MLFTDSCLVPQDAGTSSSGAGFSFCTSSSTWQLRRCTASCTRCAIITIHCSDTAAGGSVAKRWYSLYLMDMSRRRRGKPWHRLVCTGCGRQWRVRLVQAHGEPRAIPEICWLLRFIPTGHVPVSAGPLELCRAWPPSSPQFEGSSPRPG